VSLYRRGGKRLLDVVLASAGLIVALPLLAVAAAALKLDSPGPVFHRARRVGRAGRPFTFLKLRSMRADAEELRGLLLHRNITLGPTFKLHDDPRVTRVGRLLRKTSLDELPQLLHVVAGDMSLVGPRPPFPEEVEHYETWMRRRLDVRPGLTCLWQIRDAPRRGVRGAPLLPAGRHHPGANHPGRDFRARSLLMEPLPPLPGCGTDRPCASYR